jgi:hypothetical protein
MWLFMNKYRDGLWEIKEKVHFNTPFGRGLLGLRLAVYSACASYGTPFGRM